MKSVIKLVHCELKWLIIVPNDAFCIQATRYVWFFFKLIYFKRAGHAVLLRLRRSDILMHTHTNTHGHTNTHKQTCPPTYNKCQ